MAFFYPPKLWLAALSWFSRLRLPMIFVALWASEKAPKTPVFADESIAETTQIDAAAKQLLSQLSARINSAKSTRATVELTSRALVGTEELQTERAVYQIASQSTNRFTVFFKSPGQLYRVYGSKEQTSVTLADDAYLQLKPITSQELITNAPVPLGPYPEPVLALSLPNIDLAESFLVDMQEVSLANREPLNGVPAIQLHGIQSDGVAWDLWLSSDPANVQPLRLVVDLTTVVQAENSELPPGFRYEIDCFYTFWKLDASLDDSYFAFTPAKTAKRYESLDEYYLHLEKVANQHPLTGQLAPTFKAKRLVSQPNTATDKESNGQSDQESTIQSDEFDLEAVKGQIVVLDMWATWCVPCIKAMPVMEELSKQFKEQGVLFYALNVGENEETVREFLKESPIKPQVLMDENGEVATKYQVNAIPQLVIIGKDGRVELVRVGWTSLETLASELSEPIKTLVSGGTLLTDE